jgi:diacylglycerol kinase
MDEGELSPLIRNALIDKFEGWELVEFLNISIERIVDLLEEDIVDNIEDVYEELGFDIKDNDNNE